MAYARVLADDDLALGGYQEYVRAPGATSVDGQQGISGDRLAQGSGVLLQQFQQALDGGLAVVAAVDD